MGLGCDKDATWDCGNGRDDGWDLDWLHSHVAQRFGGLCENIASPNVATDAFAYSSFTLLHLAVSFLILLFLLACPGHAFRESAVPSLCKKRSFLLVRDSRQCASRPWQISMIQ